MSLLYWIAGVISLALMIYLFIALLKPEKFG
jgi:K+-transporting ATPase KdpF subunit